ncbi:hypothetical protein Tco_0456818, partial [Tanacetum coccineum]
YSSSGEDVGRDHIPTINLRRSWWKPITEDRPAIWELAWTGTAKSKESLNLLKKTWKALHTKLSKSFIPT